MPSVIEQLEREWDRLAVERRAVARLREACAVAGNAADLASLEAYVREAGPADADRVLVALAGPASAGGRLEARVLLQLLLPGVRRVARRWWALGARDEREAAAVAAVWGRICSYRLDRRPAKVAANILMDAEKELRKAAAIKRHCWEDLPADHPAPLSNPCPGEELADLLREAVASGSLTTSDAEIVAALRIGGARIADVVASHGTSERTVRRRCRAAELALARVAAA
jgi:hypothetical protein